MADGTNKRARHESEGSEANPPESKRIRLNTSELNLVHDESVVNSFELNELHDESDEAAVVNSFRDDLLDILDDSDAASVTDRYPEIQDLDSVIRSFEEEILVLRPPEVSEMTSGSGESQPELGFLLEASDDELGLPPSVSSSGDEDRNQTVDLARLSSDAVAFGEMVGFDDALPSYYSSYGFGIGGNPENGTDNDGGEFVAWDELFDYVPANYGEFSYAAESLPAL